MARTDVVEEEVEPAEAEADAGAGATDGAPSRMTAALGGLAEGVRRSLREGNRAPLVAGAAAVALGLFVWSFFAAGIDPVAWAVIGLQSGAVYSLIALGIVLVYKATRVLNFAQGELGTVPAFLAYAIMVGFDWSDTGPNPDAGRLWWATILAVLLGAGLAVLINVLVVQRLAHASPVTSLVATAGVSLLFISGEVVMFEAKVRPFPRYVDGTAFEISGVNVTWHTVIVLAVLAGAATLLALFFRTRAGVALLATAQEPFAAALSGISVRAMSTLAWATAGALAAVGGLLGAGVFGNVRPGLMTTQFLIHAFTGAVLGGLTSMVGAVVGGLLLGLTTVYANELALGLELDVPGPPQVAILAVLLLVLLVRPRGLLGKEA